MKAVNNETPTSAKELAALLKQGEGKTLEFKRSTGELKEGMQTLCAFLNAAGGMLLFGVRRDGKAEGQDVADRTLREIAQALDKFEPPVNLPVERLPVGGSREVLILRVEGRQDSVPFTYDSRAYERVGSTTRKMPQEHYEKLLLERGHAKRRWENMPAEGLTLKDLDGREILRTRELAIQQNRISPDTGRDIGEILDRLGVRQDGVLLQAAPVLYGTEFIKQLSVAHLSELRNPLIASAFHRTGAVECWGRGTNRVIAACEKHGVAAPTFEERQGFVIVTFKAPIIASAHQEKGVQSGAQSEMALKILAFLQEGSRGKTDIAERLGKSGRTRYLNELVRKLAQAELIEYTIPDKPRSSLLK